LRKVISIIIIAEVAKKAPTIARGLKLMCPMSGASIDGMLIQDHHVPAIVCRGGASLTGWCRYHSVRVFIQDPELAMKFTEKTNE